MNNIQHVEDDGLNKELDRLDLIKLVEMGTLDGRRIDMFTHTHTHTHTPANQ